MVTLWSCVVWGLVASQAHEPLDQGHPYILNYDTHLSVRPNVRRAHTETELAFTQSTAYEP